MFKPLLVAALAALTLSAPSQNAWQDLRDSPITMYSHWSGQSFCDESTNNVLCFGGLTINGFNPTPTTNARWGTYNVAAGAVPRHWSWSSNVLLAQNPAYTIGAALFDKWSDGAAIYVPEWSQAFFICGKESYGEGLGNPQLIWTKANLTQWAGPITFTAGSAPPPNCYGMKLQTFGGAVYCYGGTSSANGDNPANIYKLTRTGAGPTYTYTWTAYTPNTVGPQIQGPGARPFFIIDKLNNRLVVSAKDPAPAATYSTYYTSTTPAAGNTHFWTKSNAVVDYGGEADSSYCKDTNTGLCFNYRTNAGKRVYWDPTLATPDYVASTFLGGNAPTSAQALCHTTYVPGLRQSLVLGGRYELAPPYVAWDTVHEFTPAGFAFIQNIGANCGQIYGHSLTGGRIGDNSTYIVNTTTNQASGFWVFGTPLQPAVPCGPCFQYVNTTFLLGLTTNNAGYASLTLPIAADPTLSGAQIDMQTVVTGTGCIGLSWSDRIRLSIGY